MKALAGLIVLMALLSGCATAPSSEVTADGYQFDTDRMDAVERAAMRLGVRVYWINAPRKVSKPANG